MKHDSQSKGILYVIISAVLFGMMPLFAKIAYKYGSNAYSVAFYRFFFGFIILFLIIRVIQRESLWVNGRQMKRIFLISILYAIVPVMLYMSYDYVPSGLATTLHFTYPVFVMLITVIFFHEKPGVNKIVCCALCVSGISMLYTPGGSIGVAGLLLALVSGIVYGVDIVLLEKSGLQSLSTLKLAFWLSLFASAEIGAVSLFMGELRFSIGYQGWLAHVAMALFTTVIALVLFQKGTYICGSVKSSLLSTFEPITGVFIGMLVFHEVLTWKITLGTAFVLISTMILVLPVGRTRKE